MSYTLPRNRANGHVARAPHHDGAGCGVLEDAKRRNTGVPADLGVLNSEDTMTQRPEPLHNLPIEIAGDGVPAFGVIRYLTRSDIIVEITAPYRDLQTMLHVPHLAMTRINWLAEVEGSRTTTITDRGRRQAEWLLRRLYEHECGRPAGWAVYERRDGTWVRAEERRSRVGAINLTPLRSG